MIVYAWKLGIYHDLPVKKKSPNCLLGNEKRKHIPSGVIKHYKSLVLWCIFPLKPPLKHWNLHWNRDFPRGVPVDDVWMSGKKLVATVVVHIAIRSDRKEINNPVENKSSGWIIAGFLYGDFPSHGVPLVFIHFCYGFSLINPSILGIPIYGNLHMAWKFHQPSDLSGRMVAKNRDQRIERIFRQHNGEMTIRLRGLSQNLDHDWKLPNLFLVL